MLCISQINEISFAREVKYKVSDIPEELLEGSKMIIRNENFLFHLKSDKSATMEVTYAITILNENGEEHAAFVKWYNKFIKIQNISGRIYNKEGKVVDRVKKDKILDISAIRGFSLFEDARIKAYRPEYREFPFTVEYNYQVEYKGILNCPSWSLYRDYNTAVEKSRFTIRFPNDNPIRYYEHMAGKCVRKTEAMDSILTWEVSNLLPLRRELFSPHLSQFSPLVYTAPTDFEISGFEGNAETWENFGSWAFQLMEGREILSEEAKLEIEEIIKGVPDKRERIRLLYEYMQNRTRYANVAIGIGGYQPIEAETVDRLGYGDCKALSNYMMAILKEAEIKSYYTLIRAGSDAIPMLKSFPSNQFNHAILYVPLEEDDIWLECTSQQLPAGFVGDFTDDRNALVITDKGGLITKTCAYNQKENRKERFADVHLDNNGTGTVDLITTFRGIHYGNMVPIYHENRDEQKDFLLKTIKIPSFQLNSFEFDEVKYPEPVISGSLKFSIRNYTSMMGDRIVLPVNLINDLDIIPESLSDRKSEILIRRSESIVDSIVFYLPENYKVENHSAPVILETDFGKYKCNIVYDEPRVVYTRSLLINKGNFPVERYNDLVSFYRNIHGADQAKVIFIKTPERN